MKDEVNVAEYPDVAPEEVTFPDTIHVAFAVCTKQCGTREFIVDGSTQRCQHCGALMFRTEVAEYNLEQNADPTTESSATSG